MPQIADEFASYVQQSGTAREFCEDREMDTDRCMTRVRDTVGSQDPDAPEPAEIDHEPAQELEGLPDGDGVEDISSIVADCVGSGILGFSRPNEHACKRAFEIQQHRIERLEDRQKHMTEGPEDRVE